MSVNIQLLEAVDRLRHVEKENEEIRSEVAHLLKMASATQPIATIARITGIKRTTIYWLMDKYVTELK